MRPLNFIWMLLCAAIAVVQVVADESVAVESEFTIEGKLIIPNQNNITNIIEETQIFVDGGAYVGFIKEDHSFEIKHVAPGSYLIQVSHPLLNFEAIRVDISSKGAKRARRVNNVQPHLNQHLPYPLKVKLHGIHAYFQQRETWRVTDFLFNPMVLTMVLPVLLIMVLPKLVTEEMAQTQREVQQTTARLPEMPELSEVMASFSFLGGQRPQQPKATGSSGGGGGGSKKKSN